MASHNVDRFREEFKRYKRNQPPPDYSDVIELREEQQSGDKVSDEKMLPVFINSKYVLLLRSPFVTPYPPLHVRWLSKLLFLD